jgi:hypothetical protein
MQRPAQAKDFQLTMAYGGDAFNRRWPAGLVMARQKFGISRQCERAEETFAFQTEGRLPLLADFVAEVENRTTLKISRKSIFGLLCCCVAFQRHYGGP